MKKWPKDNKVEDFDKLITPVKKALKTAIKDGHKVYENGIGYDGYENGRYEQATCPTPDKALSADSLEYGLNEQGRDVFDVILTIAFQLGVEQGRRMTYERLDIVYELLSNQIKSQQNIKQLLSVMLDKKELE